MIHVVVPVKNEWELTRRLLDCLAIQDCRVLVIDNGSTDVTARAVRRLQRGEEWRGRLHRTHQPDLSIYEMWNHGFEWARRDACYGTSQWPGPKGWWLLLTNNDIELTPDALGALRQPLAEDATAWVTYPDYTASWSTWTPHTPYWRRDTRGVLSDGGMFGACFMLAGHRIPWRPLVTDLTYEWWYGDNHLAEEIEQHGGHQVRVVGLPVLHVNEATASKLHAGDLYGMKYRDRHRWITRYERTR